MAPSSKKRRTTKQTRHLAARLGLTDVAIAGTDVAGVFESEVRAAKVTGFLNDHRTVRACNVIESALESFVTERTDFTRCDFKDNAIRSCRFRDSKFDSSTFAYNAVVGTRFERCSFGDTDIQHCEFEGTQFHRCDLRNVLIKACTFLNCEFQDCITNNKVFETCRLSNCRFAGTELQVQSIAENFGITLNQYKGMLRDGRSDSSHLKLSPPKVDPADARFAAHPLHQLSLEYFLSESLLDGSGALDRCFAIDTWLPRSRSAGSFSLVLSRWSEFLIWLFERDELVLHVLLRLHTTTNGLIQAIESITVHTAWIAQLRGVHLSLARIVDQFLVVLENSAMSPSNQLSFIVEGGSTPSWYYRNLKPLFDRAPGMQIVRLTKHNSPWDLSVLLSHGGVFFVMALFFATRTRFELSKYTEKLAKADQRLSLQRPPARKAPRREARASTDLVTKQPILSLEFGGHQPIEGTPSFRIQAYLPGNLVAELQLDLSSQHVGRLRKILKDVL
jgi:uncharacterized protein YjbI with pentapeptide repeats